MKSSSVRDTKNVGLLVAVALLSPALMPHSAQAADDKKEKALKTGAAVLGAVGAYYVVKGKTLKGALAGAAGYYAYKKSKEADNDRTSGDVYPDDVRRRNTTTRTSTRNSDPGYVYPDGTSYDVDDDYVSTRDDRRAQRYDDRSGRTDRYPDDPGYISLNNDTKMNTQGTVLK